MDSERKKKKKIALSSTGKKQNRRKKKVKKEIFSSLEGRFLLVKVGDNGRPASPEQIKEIEKELIKLFKENDVNCLTLVTHHCVNIELF